MTEEPSLPRELALRIGSAARELPEIEVTQLVQALVRLLGTPLSEERLRSVTPAGLQQTGASMQLDGIAEATSERLSAACAVLRGVAAPAEPSDAPEPVGADQPPLAGSIQVACASSSGGNLDGHFGSCARFLIYQVNGEGAQLVAVRSTAEAGLRGRRDDKNKARAALIRDCQLLYCCSIGAPAAAKVVRAGIHPIKRAEGGDTATLMDQLATALAHRPPPWLAKVMGGPSQLAARLSSGLEEAVAD